MASDHPSLSRGAWVLRALIALVVVSLWIVFLCTAPQILGNRLAHRLADHTRLPVRDLLAVTLNSIAVVLCILATGRRRFFAVRQPKRPLLLLCLVPLSALNLTRGSFAEFEVGFYLTMAASTFLTGFWEEFLFRGLIQDRLAVLGGRRSILVTSLLFAAIHWYGGWWTVLVAFTVGLTFSLLRDRVGIWPLVIAHFLIDFFRYVVRREWDGHATVAYVVIGAHCLAGLLFLALARRPVGGTSPAWQKSSTASRSTRSTSTSTTT